MAQTLRNLSGTFKEAKEAMAAGKIEELSALNDDYEDDFNHMESETSNRGYDHKDIKGAANGQFMGIDPLGGSAQKDTDSQ
jgi:hypothetical protein